MRSWGWPEGLMSKTKLLLDGFAEKKSRHMIPRFDSL